MCVPCVWHVCGMCVPTDSLVKGREWAGSEAERSVTERCARAALQRRRCKSTYYSHRDGWVRVCARLVRR
jgi:hypothetical protein